MINLTTNKTKMKNIKNIIIAFVAVATLSSCGYNEMVAKQESVGGQWAQVETSYQRRADLIPNLVSTVKGYAEFEKSTFVEVTEARSKATSMNINVEDLTPENMAKFQNAQSQLSGSLSRLMATFERYPDLKANQNFLELQAQLEGTENRISVERRKFNEVTKDYNTYIKQFPRNIYAGWFDFEKKGYFEAEAGSEKAPKVEF